MNEAIIKTPNDAYLTLKGTARRRQECFMVLTLNGAHGVIRKRVVTIGLMNRTLIHPREVFYPAIKDNAVAIIVAHNHPSGHLLPSEDDLQITKRLIEAGNILGIPVLDHVIIGKNGYHSFTEYGEM